MASRPVVKSPNAFRTISEAAEAVGAPQHVLRFWETKFDFITPVKRAGGRRFYRPQDVVVLKAVRRLLHEEGLTIKGVLRLHKEQGLGRLAAYGDGEAGAAAASRATDAPATHDRSLGLQRLLIDIEGARARLDAVLGR